MSSAEEEEDDDEGFELLTAENLFSSLLSRVSFNDEQRKLIYLVIYLKYIYYLSRSVVLLKG